MWQRGGGVPPDGDQLRSNRHRNLFRRDGADVESHRSMYAIEQVRGQSLFLQRLEYLNHFALGADHANVAGARLHRPAQDAHIVAMPAGDDHDVGSLVRVELLDGLVEIKGMHLASSGETILCW